MFVLVSLGILTVVPALLEDSVLGDAAKTAISIARWPLLAIAFGAGLAVLYRHGPSRDAAEWRWVSPGAVVATVLWLMGSALFSVYVRSEEHTSELQSLMRLSYAVFCLKTKNTSNITNKHTC